MGGMKDSGVEWIGEIPQEWGGCIPLRFCDEQDSKTSQFVLGKPYIALENVASWTGQVLLEEEAAQVDSTVATYSANDVLFGKLRPYLAKVVRPGSAGQCSTELLPIQPRKHTRDYLFWLLINKGFIDTIDSMTYGVKMPRTSWNQIGSIAVPVPPKAEQRAIAAFLDKECAAIDAAAETLETQISTLERYRASVIHEAVTRGLDPAAPTKPSGVEWIGDIPQGWTTHRVKYVASISSGSTPSRDNLAYWDGDIPWVKTGELRNSLLCKAEEGITRKALAECPMTLYPAGTILVAMYGQGKTRGMTAKLGLPCTINQACAALTANELLVKADYLWLCFIAGYDAIRAIAQGSGQPNLNADLIANFAIPIPTLAEQEEISSEVFTRTASIDSITATKREQLDVLRRRRQSLIYEYVTGKRRVGEV